MTKVRRMAPVWLAPVVFLACQSNPVLVDDGNLTAELTLSAGHVHTLSEVGLEVVIRNGDGYVVDDFEAVTVDRRSGGGSWRSIELTPHDDHFTGAYTFSSSGDYDLRVMVTRHGAVEPAEVPLVHGEMNHLQVGRAHIEVEGRRIEFETYPGHIHEGDEVEVRFWVLESERDPSGVRPPIGGLQAQVLCYEAGEMVEDHAVMGDASGVYPVMHTFLEAGDARAVLQVTDSDGTAVEASFDFHVVHGH